MAGGIAAHACRDGSGAAVEEMALQVALRQSGNTLLLAHLRVSHIDGMPLDRNFSGSRLGLRAARWMAGKNAGWYQGHKGSTGRHRSWPRQRIERRAEG